MTDGLMDRIGWLWRFRTNEEEGKKDQPEEEGAIDGGNGRR